MITNPTNGDQLTIDELRAYQAGLLTGAARHRVERLLLENPFYADALAGLEALQQTGASLPAQTAQLRSALHRRVRESATKQRLWPLWLSTAIAAILLVLCITIYLIFFTKPGKPAQPARPVRQPVSVTTPPASRLVTEERRGLHQRLPGDVYQPANQPIPLPKPTPDEQTGGR